MTAAGVKRLLKAQADPKKACFSPISSKPAPAHTGKGTGSMGSPSPKCRKIAKRAWGMKPAEISKLLKSPMHEEREVALLILVDAFNRAKSDRDRDDV